MEHAPPVRLTLKEGLCMESRPEPCGMVIFGASGDLASRKLLPSLGYLKEQTLLPEGFFVLGLARTALSEAEFRAKASGLSEARYISGDYLDPAAYRALKKRLDELHARNRTRGNTLFYLAVPPPLYGVIPRMLDQAGLLDKTGGWRRVIVEKPFGEDLASARKLDDELHEVLDETRIYRIDHYLGKETVQNILIFRFANSIFEPVWNRDHIDHVQISALESVGVEHRAGYYDKAGVIRDMFQNHMLQLLALTAMEAPAGFEADRVRDEKMQVLRSLKPLDPARSVILGQYEGYPAEKGVAAGSRTPTFGAMRLEVGSWRWSGVPFYLRAGKALGARRTEIAVTFKAIPHSIFSPLTPKHFCPNTLIFRIQPDEGISLTFSAKKPGPKLCIGSLTMDFDYTAAFGSAPPESYARLLLDCMLGDQTLFIRHDAVEESWRYLEPLLTASDLPVPPYARGSSGPKAAEELPARDGRSWVPCG